MSEENPHSVSASYVSLMARARETPDEMRQWVKSSLQVIRGELLREFSFLDAKGAPDEAKRFLREEICRYSLLIEYWKEPGVKALLRVTEDPSLIGELLRRATKS